MGAGAVGEGTAAAATGKDLVPLSVCKRQQMIYEAIRVMKNQQAKAVRVIIYLVVLVVLQGCTTFQNRASGKSWSQIAGEEEQQHQLNQSLEGE
jgi:hypothetical protein